MIYLEYEKYAYLGGKLDLTVFHRYIVRACRLIDNATQARVSKMENVPEEIEFLCRDLVDYLSANAETDGKITSKSVSSGPVSESESYAVKTAPEQAKEIADMICDYLMSVTEDSGTPLLYRGCTA